MGGVVPEAQGAESASHPTAQASEQALVVQGPQGVQLLHRCDQGLHWGGVHEVEREQVINAHGLEQTEGSTGWESATWHRRRLLCAFLILQLQLKIEIDHQ